MSCLIQTSAVSDMSCLIQTSAVSTSRISFEADDLTRFDITGVRHARIRLPWPTYKFASTLSTRFFVFFIR